jgi:hypothetical protein
MIFLSVKQSFVWVTIIPRHCIVSQTDSFPSFSESIFLTDNSSMWNRFFCLSDNNTWTFFIWEKCSFSQESFVPEDVLPSGHLSRGRFVTRTSQDVLPVYRFLHFPSRTNPAQMWRALFGLATGIQTSSTTCMEPRYMSTGWCLKQLLYWFLMLLCALWSFSVWTCRRQLHNIFILLHLIRFFYKNLLESSSVVIFAVKGTFQGFLTLHFSNLGCCFFFMHSCGHQELKSF